MRYFLWIPLIIACAPGEATSKYELLDDDVTSDTSELPGEPSGEPSGEPAGEPSGEPSSEPSGDPSSDEDADGFTIGDGDCDDDNADVNPDVSESENGIDDDCDGIIDEGTNAYDDDEDGLSENDGDCDDGNADVYPGAVDVMDDGVDQDCSGSDRSCANPTTISWTVTFPATSGCDWGNNGNLPDDQGVITARTEQEEIYTPPSSAVMCEVRPSIQSNQGGYEQSGFEYDDDLLMTYNDYVLFSTSDSFIDSLSSGSWGGKLYDWNNVKGNNAFNGFLWEWGNTQFWDGFGFDLSIANNKINNLNDMSVNDQSMSFMLVVMGDNDNAGSGDGADCYHNGLSFPVEIDLAE